jgi:hypothetical protein
MIELCAALRHHGGRGCDPGVGRSGWSVCRPYHPSSLHGQGQAHGSGCQQGVDRGWQRYVRLYIQSSRPQIFVRIAPMHACTCTQLLPCVTSHLFISQSAVAMLIKAVGKSANARTLVQDMRGSMLELACRHTCYRQQAHSKNPLSMQNVQTIRRPPHT